MPNRLANSSSPYLRQHQNNPVDWFPWGQEALDRAASEDKPIFLSVGYSACHWCHVMEHESFEDEKIAAILNEEFVSIKVDREERPDIDQIYMQAVQMMTGSGGWPMSVFMAPNGRPFYAGTYWPPDSRWGRPGFGQVLLAVADAWKNKQEQITEQGEQVTMHLDSACRGPAAAEGSLNPEWIAKAASWLVQHHDSEHGGFGGAPKFPHAMDLSLLLELTAVAMSNSSGTHSERYERAKENSGLKAVRHTLDKMARGGIYDHLGGGFARYSVDEKWLVPHFEKMLYDNALLVVNYADAYRLTGDLQYAQTTRETLDYILRDMTNELGGYHSTEDADSEGVEGKFYVWSVEEITEVLGTERGAQFCDCYDVTQNGNFEGSNILNLPQPIRSFAQANKLDPEKLAAELEEDRQQLLQRRCSRIRPGLDDKVLLSWNALMITGMVHGYRALGDAKYLQSANTAVGFIQDHMTKQDGRLWHTWREGVASLDAYLDDYSYFIDALTELFQVTGTASILAWAIELADDMIARFSDPAGGFFFTANDHEQLIARSKDLADSSVPSGNGMAAMALSKLGRLTGKAEYVAKAEETLKAASGVMVSSPQAAGQSLRALLRFTHPERENILFAPEPQSELETTVHLLRSFDPTGVEVVIKSSQPTAELIEICPLVRDRHAVESTATLYRCESGTCQRPISGVELDEYFNNALGN